MDRKLLGLLFLVCALMRPATEVIGQPVVVDGTINQRGGNSATIVRPSYDYSATLMKDTNGKFRMWWCGASTTNQAQYADKIYYSESTSLGSGWTTPTVVLSPTGANTFDRDHVCDPSVVKVGGTYYMYYSGGVYSASQGTAVARIGVATSTNGTAWTRANGGLQIISPVVAQNYGAGQPSVVYLDEWYYMVYFDSTGLGGPGIYAMRSRSPLFPATAQTQELRLVGGVPAFQEYSSPQHTSYRFRDAVNVDLSFSRLLNAFVVSIDGIPGQLSQAFYSRDLAQDRGVFSWPSNWVEGPAILKGPAGTSVPDPNSNLFQGQGQCVVSFDIFRALGTTAFNTWDLGWSGIDMVAQQRCARGVVAYDHDRDGTSDTVVYRRSNNRFYVRRSNLGAQEIVLGNSSATPVKGDFDGDGLADAAVVVPNGSYLDWHISYSGGGSRYQPTWGFTTDTIVVGDYNGDRKDDIAVYRAGTWYIIYHTGATEVGTLGAAGEIPVPNDFDGDNLTDFAVVNLNTGIWSVVYRAGGYANVYWGSPGDIPVTADFFNEGRSSLGVWRPSNGTWYLRSLTTGASAQVQWGLPGDVPVVGDYNGDGIVDLTVWRPSDGNWYQNRRTGEGVVVQWGLSSDLIPTNRCVGSNSC